MSDLHKAAVAALEALEGVLDTYGEPLDLLSISGGAYEALQCRDAITALKAALAEPVQEQDTDCHAQGICQRSGYSLQLQRKQLAEGKPWVCACGANLYIDDNGAPRSKA